MTWSTFSDRRYSHPGPTERGPSLRELAHTWCSRLESYDTFPSRSRENCSPRLTDSTSPETPANLNDIPKFDIGSQDDDETAIRRL